MKKNTGDFKTDLEQLLQEGNIIRLKPQGFSMYPLFIPGRDEALIQQVPVTSLREMMWLSTAAIREFWFCTVSFVLLPTAII